MIILGDINKHTIKISEEQVKSLCESAYNEDSVGEGGVFNINNIGDDGNMSGNYEYYDDINDTNPSNKNVYVDFSNSGLKFHPSSKEWVEVPKSWMGNIKQTPNGKGYETIDNKNPRSPNSKDKGDKFVKGYRNKFYMPTRQYRGKGDNIGVRKTMIPITSDIQIPCYNLSLLGDNPTTATMLAHMYKGKESTYDGHYNITTNGVPTNIKAYLKNMANLFKTNSELSSFVPDYIVYPQSSSGFNGLIAKSLRYVYPNAKILDASSITKVKVWGVNYDTLVDLTIKDLSDGVYSSTFKRYKNNTYFNKNLTSNTIYKSAQQLMMNTIGRSLNSILESDEYINANGKENEQDAIFKQIEAIFNREYEQLKLSMEKRGLQPPKRDEMFLLVLNAIMTNENYGKYSSDFSKRNAKKNGGRESLYYSIDAFKKAFISKDPKVYLNIVKIKELAMKNDTIKNYDASQRFAIKGQFHLSDNASNTIPSNSKILIIDDNYATGVSLRNAAILFIEKGIEPSNIITMTPGDMGGASTGGKRGSDVPFFDAEGRLANDYVKGNLDNTQVSSEMAKYLTNKHNLLKNNSGHKKRDTLVGGISDNLLAENLIKRYVRNILKKLT